MLEYVHDYAVDVDDIFEEIINKDGYELNHVIIKPGKMFPAHPTDANVTIIIVRGKLSLQLAENAMKTYTKGQIVEIDKGTMSSLGNKSDDVTEVFVIKSKRG